MAEFVSDCPRCGAQQATQDVFSSVVVRIEYRWQRIVEIACICRKCHKLSIQIVSQRANPITGDREKYEKFFGGPTSRNTLSAYPGSLNDLVEFQRVITLRDRAGEAPPEHLPPSIHTVVAEGNVALANQCFNAAGAMYRLALDMATKSRLPEPDGPNAKTVRSLGLRLEWMFENQVIPSDLRVLAECVREDGNDGAHDGTLTQTDADDLHDFTCELLRRLYTEPERLRMAQQRRAERRAKQT